MRVTLPRREVVLLGAGHTNAHVLRMWKMKPISEARLTCVSNFAIASYSGMMPAVLADEQSPERMQIDLPRLCASVGARLIVADVNGIDVHNQRLLFEGRPPLAFDALSIGIGSVPAPPCGNAGSALLPIKPMQTFLRRLEDRLADLARSITGRPIRICVVGAGIAGVEIVFCLGPRLRKHLRDDRFQLTLVNGNDTVGHGARVKTQQLIRRGLEERGIRLRLGGRVRDVSAQQLIFEDGATLDADLVLWTTAAVAPPLFETFGELKKDQRGFLLTKQCLQVVGDHPIFAVGDSGTIEGMDLPKAGVYAVRQGRVLWNNIDNLLQNRPLEAYRPQTDFLKLLNTGDGRAILENRSISLHNRFARWLKGSIDGRFMDKFQDYQPMERKDEPPASPSDAMRCAGCGSKVAGSVLSKVLKRLAVPSSDEILLGLDQPDDAAIVRTHPDQPTTVTVDFFSAPLDDPYLVGRIATLNSASDLFAMGTQPIAALAIATIPQGSPRRQEELLYQLLAGSMEELTRMGASLVGGHTTEGPQILIGFTMLANRSPSKPSTKQELQPGDCLVMTKPIGTGALLAAHMRARCEAAWWTSLMEMMLQSNQVPAERALQLGLHGITDVTGFGLAGHLLEMLRASNVAAELSLAALPVLSGAEAVVQAGIESTLAPSNRDVEPDIKVGEDERRSARYALMFDPQTSGGLMIAVPRLQRDQLLSALDGCGTVVGHVIPYASGDRRLVVTA